MKKLPIGVQNIEKILGQNEYVYVDKTGYIKRLIDQGFPHYFISRPRRFGKSLFINTLEEVFKGNRPLFKGLLIDQSDYEWEKYPVLRFDFSQVASQTSLEFKESMKRLLLDTALSYGIVIEAPTVKEGLKALVEGIYRAQKRKVAVLVDEYDHPIINRLNHLDIAQGNRDILKDFFTILKSLDHYLQFIPLIFQKLVFPFISISTFSPLCIAPISWIGGCFDRTKFQALISAKLQLLKHEGYTFVTGVSKFSQVSLFSGPNHLKDLTMDPRYAGIMGYTEEELKQTFSPYICAMGENKKSDILEEMRTWYNGYRFSSEAVSVYNPFSILNYLNPGSRPNIKCLNFSFPPDLEGENAPCFRQVCDHFPPLNLEENRKSPHSILGRLPGLDEQEPKAYWYSTGTPSFLIDELKKHSASIVSLDGAVATQETLMDISSFEKIDLAALMYQTGYFTITGYNTISKRYQLGLPKNLSVKKVSADFSVLLSQFCLQFQGVIYLCRYYPLKLKTKLAKIIQKIGEKFYTDRFNEEVRSAFINSLVQHFASIPNLRSSRESVEALENHQIDVLFQHIGRGFASFAYQVFVDAKERTYQAMLLSMLYGMGFDPLSEKATSTGLIDVVLEMPRTTYILELKLNGSAEKALQQIYKKEYFKAYTHKGKQIVMIGANFSSEIQNISEWKGELLSEAGDKLKNLSV